MSIRPLASALALAASAAACTVQVPSIACDTDANCPQGQRCGDDRRCTTRPVPPPAPAAPAISGTEPASPGRTRTPLVRGTAEPDALVEVYLGEARLGGGHANAAGEFAFALTTALAANAASELTARVTNAAARRSDASEPRTYAHDDLAPEAGAVLDGPSGGDESDVTASTSTLESHWSGFVDASRIVQYVYSISATDTCPGGVVPPTATADGGTSIKLTGLALSDEVTYSTCVRATDAAGNDSAWVRSDGVRVDRCSADNGGCDVHARCGMEAGSLTCRCENGYFGDGWACTAGFSLGAPASLATLPSGNCWFSNLAGGAVTKASGEHHLVTGVHRTCDTRVDTIVDHRSLDGVTWTPTTLGSYDYFENPPGEPWGRGIPGSVAATLDSGGELHVLGELRPGSGYWSPGRLWYLFEGAGGWEDADIIGSDEHIQVAQGNSTGAPNSGLSVLLGFDPAAGLLRLFGTDGAWYATRSNAISTAAAPGARSWPPLEVVESVPGIVDRGTLTAAAQDFDGARGVQVWVDKPACALHGREFVNGIPGPLELDQPLGLSFCTADANGNYGFAPAAEALWRGDELEVLVYASSYEASAQRRLVWLHRDGAGAWTRTTLGWDGVPVQSAFVDGKGRLAILRYVAPAHQLELFHPATATGQPLLRGLDEVLQLAVPRRSPGFAAWVERTAAGTVLKAAKLVLAE